MWLLVKYGVLYHCILLARIGATSKKYSATSPYHRTGIWTKYLFI